MKDIRVTVEAKDVHQEFEGEGVMVIAFNAEGDEMADGLVAHCYTHGEFEAPEAYETAVEYVCELIDEAVMNGNASVIDGVSFISDVVTALDNKKNELFSKWALKTAKDPNFDRDALLEEVGEHLANKYGGDYADESEHDDFSDETDNADFTS